MRISYEVGGLLEQHVAKDPLQQFDAWFKDASACKVGWMMVADGGGLCRCSAQRAGSARMGIEAHPVSAHAAWATCWYHSPTSC
jgi:hypothetical protein